MSRLIFVQRFIFAIVSLFLSKLIENFQLRIAKGRPGVNGLTVLIVAKQDIVKFFLGPIILGHFVDLLTYKIKKDHVVLLKKLLEYRNFHNIKYCRTKKYS